MTSPQPTVKVPRPRFRRRRRSALSRVLLWTFLLGLFAAFSVLAAVILAHGQFTAPGPLGENRVFIVQPGLSATAIGAELERNGIISNGRIFTVMAQLTGQRTRLQAGEYAFPRGASMQAIMALIANGKAITYKLSIPEGFTSEMAVARVNANEVLTGPPAVVPPEGSLLPDTYVFRRGMTRQQLVDDMQAAQQKLLDKLWASRVPTPLIETRKQAVTLASIVEKETSVAEERPVIASVFLNRLAKGMRLQSDPTIIYGIVGGKGRLDRALTRADIEETTPYNTYRINGLPPGPIANPGRAALEAVLRPTATENLYFVADGTGGHAFAATLQEHNRNVRKWRKIAGNAAAAAAAEDGSNAPPEPSASAASAAEAAAPETEGPLAAVTESVEGSSSAAAPVAPQPAEPSTSALAPGTIVLVEGRQAVIPRLRPPR